MGLGIGTSYRYGGNLTKSAHAVIHWPALVEYVEGCEVTVTANVREVTVAEGNAWAAGGVDEVTGASLTLGENTSGLPRIDLVCVSMNWGTDTSALVVVQGTPASSPVASTGALARTPGVEWHLPLAQVRVNAGDGVLSAGQVTDVRPGPWIDLTIRSPWTPWSGDYHDPQRRKTPNGDVQIRGMIGSSSSLSSTDNPLVDIPVMWRPTNREIFAQVGSPLWEPADRVGGEGLVRVDMRSDLGYLSAYRPNRTDAQSRWVTLSGIHWSTI